MVILTGYIIFVSRFSFNSNCYLVDRVDFVYYIPNTQTQLHMAKVAYPHPEDDQRIADLMAHIEALDKAKDKYTKELRALIYKVETPR